MNELDIVRFQVEVSASKLGKDVQRYYDALHELRRITLLLFSMSGLGKPDIDDKIDAWLAEEGFGLDPHGFWQRLPLLEQFRNGAAPDDSISLSWPAHLVENKDARYRMYCLRDIGRFLKEIQERLPGAVWIYYQDTSNTALQYPYIDQITAITPNFDWSTYHTWVSVAPENNPGRAIQWTAPTIDYAGKGLILSVSIPIYLEDEFIGAWSIDVALSTFLRKYNPDIFITDQVNFVIDQHGGILDHPQIKHRIDPEKGSTYLEDISVLGKEFGRLNLEAMKADGCGTVRLKNDAGEVWIGHYCLVPEVGWLLFTIYSEASAFQSLTRSFYNTFERIFQGDLIQRKRDDSELNFAYEMLRSYKQIAETLELKETERREVQKELIENQRKLATLFKNLPGAVYRCENRQDWRMELLSNGVQAITGYRPQELIRNRVLAYADLIKEEDREYVWRNTQEQLKKKSPFEIKYRIITKDGDEKWVWERGSGVYSDDGEVIAIEGFITDISKMTALEQERTEIEKQLRQAQKMEAIGTLAGGIAHDFNNILSVILGYTQLALYDLPENDPRHGSLNEVLRATDRAKELVRQILTFSRQTDQAVSPIRISPILKETLSFLRSSLPTTIEIRHDIRSTEDSILANPTEIHQIVMNLCTNAAHAMRQKGGTLEIVLAREDAPGLGDEPGAIPGPYLRLSVSDTGYGIQKGILDRIFEPYFTTKAPGEGTGVGLAVVHGIVTSRGGVIQVDSEPAKGTTFHVYWPVISGAIEPQKETEGDVPTGRERILFVDDEEILVDIGRKMLEKLGYTVDVATSGQMALDLIEENGLYDLVITDQTMPGMTGAQLTTEMNRRQLDIPVIMCTGFSETISEEKAKEIGIKAFLMKPVVLRELALVIRNILS